MAVRKLLLLSLIVLACAATALSQELTEKEVGGLKGPVKTVRTKSYRSVQGEPAADAPWSDVEVTFDREGRKVEEASYEPGGRPWRRAVFTYDAEGSTEVTYKPDGTVLHRVVRRREEFDKERRTGRVVITRHEGATTTEFVNRYDARGRLVEGSVYDREGKLQSRSVWRRRADGGFQEFIQYSGAGAVLQRLVRVPEGMQVFIYGADGALVSEETRRLPVCRESDAYGNCKNMTATSTFSMGGRVKEIIAVTLCTYTYY